MHIGVILMIALRGTIALLTVVLHGREQTVRRYNAFVGIADFAALLGWLWWVGLL